MSNFRSEFVGKLLQDIEKKSMQVKPKECGILRNQYSQMYKNTIPQLRCIVLEQLLLAAVMFILSSNEVYCDDDLSYLQFVMKVQKQVAGIVREYTAAFELDFKNRNDRFKET